jgi:hypothetical protein
MLRLAFGILRIWYYSQMGNKKKNKVFFEFEFPAASSEKRNFIPSLIRSRRFIYGSSIKSLYDFI